MDLDICTRVLIVTLMIQLYVYVTGNDDVMQKVYKFHERLKLHSFIEAIVYNGNLEESCKIICNIVVATTMYGLNRVCPQQSESLAQIIREWTQDNTLMWVDSLLITNID